MTPSLLFVGKSARDDDCRLGILPVGFLLVPVPVDQHAVVDEDLHQQHLKRLMLLEPLAVHKDTGTTLDCIHILFDLHVVGHCGAAVLLDGDVVGSMKPASLLIVQVHQAH